MCSWPSSLAFSDAHKTTSSNAQTSGSMKWKMRLKPERQEWKFWLNLKGYGKSWRAEVILIFYACYSSFNFFCRLELYIFTWCAAISIVSGFLWSVYATPTVVRVGLIMIAQYISKHFMYLLPFSSHFFCISHPLIALKMDWNFPVYYFLFSGKTKLSL